LNWPQEEDAKAAVILKSALDEKDQPEEEEFVRQEIGREFDDFERTEPLVSQTVEPAFFERHFAASNVVDLTCDDFDGKKEIFANPFYQVSILRSSHFGLFFSFN
jgi:hypothetical protein